MYNFILLVNSFIKITIRITLIHETCFIKPTYGYNNIKILIECFELMLIADVLCPLLFVL